MTSQYSDFCGKCLRTYSCNICQIVLAFPFKCWRMKHPNGNSWVRWINQAWWSFQLCVTASDIQLEPFFAKLSSVEESEGVQRYLADMNSLTDGDSPSLTVTVTSGRVSVKSQSWLSSLGFNISQEDKSRMEGKSSHKNDREGSSESWNMNDILKKGGRGEWRQLDLDHSY